MSAPVTMWQRSVPALLSTAFPGMPSEPGATADIVTPLSHTHAPTPTPAPAPQQAPGSSEAGGGDGTGSAGLVYEYKVLTLEAAGNNWRATVLVRLAAADGGAPENGTAPAGGRGVREELRPQRLAHDMRVRSGVAWAQSSAANPVLRFSDDVPYMLHDRRYRCDGAPGCGASMRIRAWAAVSDVPTRDASKAPRTCAHCGRKGHRKQSCCEQPGNCRVEVEWCHNHSIEVPSGAAQLLEGAPIDPTAPPPAALLNGDANGNGKRMSDLYGGGTLKKSRPSSGASGFAPVPGIIPCGVAAAAGANGQATHACSCDAARAARSRCQEKLGAAQEALRALHDSIQDLAALHDTLSNRAQAQAGALCTIDSLTAERDRLRAEIEELWQQRAALQPEQEQEGAPDGDADAVGVSVGPGSMGRQPGALVTKAEQVAGTDGAHPPAELRSVPPVTMGVPVSIGAPVSSMPMVVSMGAVSMNGGGGVGTPSPTKLVGAGVPQMIRMDDGQAAGMHDAPGANGCFSRMAEGGELVNGDEGHLEEHMVSGGGGDPQMVRLEELEQDEHAHSDVEPGGVMVEKTGKAVEAPQIPGGEAADVMVPSEKVHKVQVALSGGDVHQEVLEFASGEAMECGDNTETDDK